MEAVLAAARMGKKAALITMETSKLALMSCNPAVGGIGKSQLVKEVDALGGMMALAIDATGIQFRRLNLSRGPAVWSTRAQADRRAYSQFVVDYVVSSRNVEVIEGLVADIQQAGGNVTGVTTEDGRRFYAKAVIITTGTFLGGLIHIGEQKIEAGRLGEPAANSLSKSLAQLGLEIGRLKTGTPPRLNGDTIDWSKCQIQCGEEPMPFFSPNSPLRTFHQIPCHLTNTTERTKEIVSANFGKSPIFSGGIKSTGPRYCPSIEAKFHRFSDKPSHQIFLEPEGNGTNEIYPNGFSTALPEEIQGDAIRTVTGLEEVEITQPGYAIEYDYCPAHQVDRSLECRQLAGLFLAGQINGTSGYEEAAAQGLMAGVNASLYIDDEPPFILDRSEAYIGVMIDDLTTRSTTEPYRMFTSRAEYRLALREDNSRDRLMDHAMRLGLVERTEYEQFRSLQVATESAIMHFRKTRIPVDDLGELGKRFKKQSRVSLARLLKQPGFNLPDLLPLLSELGDQFTEDREALERAAITIRYEGYIDKQQREIDRFKKLETETIPDDFTYERVPGLKTEAREKFVRFRPDSLGQAGRMEGVTPGDIAVLAVYLKRHKSGRGQQA